MVVEARIHENEVGTKFDLTIKDEDDAVVDISQATTKQIIFQKPDKTNLTKTADFITDGTDGKIRYISIALDLVGNGRWSYQAYIVTPAGSWRSNTKNFIVWKNL